MYYVSRVLSMLALAALGISVWYSIVLARADWYFRTGTPAGVARAVQITPRNTEYLAQRALQLDYDGQDSTALTEKIAQLNRLSSAPRIKLGLAAELRGDQARAERWLIDAATVDRQFEPRWTLANESFRANRPEEFWMWMRAALRVSYGDRTPAFDLCWRISSDARQILSRAIPDSHDVIAAYLVYLSATKRLEAVPEAARGLAVFHEPADRALLLGLTDELLASGNAASIELWRMAGEGEPKGIFNGDFEKEPLNHGFDWRLLDAPGVKQVAVQPGHRIVFSGQQPEACAVLQQILRLEAGKQYRMEWQSRTSGMKAPAGLEWSIAGESALLTPSGDWSTGSLAFTAADEFQSLTLQYRRPVGESRAEGSVELKQVHIAEVRD